MFCSKCGTQYPDNGSCPNCSAENNFFSSAGSLDDSMDMGAPSPQPQAYTEPQPQAYAEPQPQSYAPNANAQYANNNMYNEPPVNTSYASAPQYTGVANPAPSSGVNVGFIVQIIIAICLFVSMFAFPIASEGDITFMDNFEDFGEIIENIDMLFELDSTGTMVTLIWMLGFVAMSVLLLIFTLIKNKTLCVLSSILGAVSVALPMLYNVSENNVDLDIFGLGMWAPIILFVVHIIVTVCTKKR